MDQQGVHQRRRFKVTAEDGIVLVERWEAAALGAAGYDAVSLTQAEAAELRDALAAALEHPGSAAITG